MMEQKAETAWGQIVLTAAITAVFTIVSGLAVYYFTKRDANLVYSLVKMEPFIGTTANMAIYRLEISNSGRGEIEGLTAVIRFPNGKIQDRRSEVPASFQLLEKQSPDSYAIDAQNLNPKDKLAFAFLVAFGSQEPGKPDISIRGKGVVANRVDSTTSPMEAGWIKYGILLLGAATSLISTVVVRFKGVRSLSSGLFHGGDQAHVLAYLCFVHGFVEEGNELLNRKSVTYYWSESDRLVALALASGNEERVKEVRKLLIGLLTYVQISDVSTCVVQFNVAKLCQACGQPDEARVWLRRATSGPEDEIRLRLLIDETMRQFAAASPDAIESGEIRRAVTGIKS